jgi:arginase
MAARPVIVGAPSAIGISPYGDGGPRRLDLAPAALREQGLVGRLGGRDLGDGEPPGRYRDLERPPGRIRNEEDVAAYSRALADRLAGPLHEKDFVVLLGGDCTILFGALLALLDEGSGAPGLVYIDAHADFATLDESPSGSACSMNLALAVGRADSALARLAGDGPLVRAEKVAHVGSRDGSDPEYGHHALGPAGVLDLSQSVIDSKGIAAVVAEALERVTAAPGGFWVHFDSDVLDPELMPAVDSPIPGGLDLVQAVALLTPFVQHPAARGLQVTLYDPTLDSGDAGARVLAEILERAVKARA